MKLLEEDVGSPARRLRLVGEPLTVPSVSVAPSGALDTASWEAWLKEVRDENAASQARCHELRDEGGSVRLAYEKLQGDYERLRREETERSARLRELVQELQSILHARRENSSSTSGLSRNTRAHRPPRTSNGRGSHAAASGRAASQVLQYGR